MAAMRHTMVEQGSDHQITRPTGTRNESKRNHKRMLRRPHYDTAQGCWGSIACSAAARTDFSTEIKPQILTDATSSSTLGATLSTHALRAAPRAAPGTSTRRPGLGQRDTSIYKRGTVAGAGGRGGGHRGGSQSAAGPSPPRCFSRLRNRDTPTRLPRPSRSAVPSHSEVPPSS